MDSSVGQRIRETRNIRNKTQAWLAEKVGVRQSSVSDWENTPDIKITMEHLIKVARALSVDFAWLAGDENAIQIDSKVAKKSSELNIEIPTEEQCELLRRFNELPASRKFILMALLRDWTK